MASSDANGIARISNLPAGIYLVSASQSAGSNLQAAAGTPLVVKAGAVTATQAALTDAGPDYLPLAEGNQWTFDSMTLGVQATKRVGTVTALALARTAGGRPFYLARGLNEVYCLGLQRSTGTDQTYWPAVMFFSTTPGRETATLPNWGTVTVESRNATVGVPAGQFTNCIELTLSYDGTEENWYLAPGVGPCMIEISGVAGAVARLTSYVLH
jgi:hypothetical protein